LLAVSVVATITLLSEILNQTPFLDR
jgi:hypothetical protein